MTEINWKRADRGPYAPMYLDFGQLIHSDGVTLVTVFCSTAGFEREFIGVAKRQPGDKDSIDIGANLAFSRALAKASRFFEKQGNGLVKHEDELRQARLAARKEAERKAKAKATRDAKKAKAANEAEDTILPKVKKQ